VTAYVSADDHQSELIAVVVLGIPATTLTLFLGCMALLLSRRRRTHVIRPALLALTGCDGTVHGPNTQIRNDMLWFMKGLSGTNPIVLQNRPRAAVIVLRNA
jgi:hypothetical protein